MSRIPKWKAEKTKVKVVFRLQFHATHVPLSGWDKLFVSFIPADTGKATAKTTKANVRNGNCKWSDPIYETKGSSRSSILGEASINLADFADASTPSSLSLPLIGCDYGTVLHITVQLLTSKTGFREFEQQRELSVKGFQAVSGQRIHNPAEIAGASLEMEREQVNNARVKLKKDSTGLPSLAEVGESTEDYEDSAAAIDSSSNTSESLYTEKNEISSIHEVSSFKSMISGDVTALPFGQSPSTVKGDLHGWSSDDYADNDIVTAYNENNSLRVKLEGVESAFLQLKSEADSLQSLTNELGAETQSLVNQLAVELASREKFTRDVSVLKSECYKFKHELEKLKSATAVQCFPGQDNILNHLQVKWLQGLLLLEGKVREIQNKACLGYHGSDFDFMISDFDVLGSILQKLKQETSIELVEETRFKEIQLTRVLETEPNIQGQGLVGTYANATNVVEEKMHELLQKLEESNTEKGILTRKMDQMECYYETLIQELEESRHQTVNELENLRTEHSSCLYTISALQGQIEKLQHDMNEQFIRFTADNRELDSFNKELENRAVASETALKTVRWNYAIAVDRLQKDLELLSYQVLSMYETNENLAKQSLLDGSQLFPHHYLAKSSDDQSEIISMKTNFEKATVGNGISDQGKYGAVSNFDISKENKNIFYRGLPRNVDLLAKEERSTHMNGLNVANQLRNVQEENNVVCYSDLLSSDVQRKEVYCEGFTDFDPKCDSQSQKVKPDKQLLGDNFGSEEKGTSQCMLQELQSSYEAEISEMHIVNMHFEVYIEVLKETVRSVNDQVMHMKEEMSKLAHQLEQSTADKELLILKLHNALSEVNILREHDANCHTKCDDLMLKNHILETKIHDISGENNSLTKKIVEYEELLKDCGVFESKYKNCLEDKNKLEDMLKNESLQKSCLQSELISIAEDFKTLKEEFDHQSSSNSKLQETLSYLQKKLQDLFDSMVSFNEEINSSTMDDLSLKQELESNNHMAIVLHLEKFQQEAYKKILQLHEEKKATEEEKDIAHCTLNKTESQILHLKQEFKSDLEEMTMKLDLSNALNEKLKLELLDIAEQLKLSVEAEENHKNANRELSSKLTILEIEIQQANDEHKGLAQKLYESYKGREDHEKTRLNLTDCMQENKALTMSIESMKVESIQLENEVCELKEGLESAHDNLNSERRLREELEATVRDLKLQLKDKCQQLQSCDEQKSELIFLRQRVIDLETEMQHFMPLRVEYIQLENQLSDLKEVLKSAQDNLHSERRSREELEATVGDLKLQLEDKCQQLQSCDEQKAELINLKQRVVDLETDMQHFESMKVESVQLENELSDFKEGLKSAHDNLHSERRLREELEATVGDLKLQLEDKCQQLQSCDKQKPELIFLRQRVIDLETEMQHLVSMKVEYIQLENQLSELKEVVESAHDNLHSERRLREELEATVGDLKLQLEDKCQQLQSCEEQKHELIYLRQRVIDLETQMQHFESAKVESVQLENELSDLKEDLKSAHDNLHSERRLREELEATVGDLKLQLEYKCQQLQSCEEHKLELIYLRQRVIDLQTEMQQFESMKVESVQLESELSDLKELLKHAHNSLHSERRSREELEATVGDLKLQLEVKCQQLRSCDEQKPELIHLRQRVIDLETEMQHFEFMKVESVQLENELSDLKESLKSAHDSLHSERRSSEELEATVRDLKLQLEYKCQQLQSCDEQKPELIHLRQRVIDLETEMQHFEPMKVESVQPENELSDLKEGLKSAHDNMHSERRLREELEATVGDLKLQLEDRCQQLQSCDQQKPELIFLRQRVIDLETEMQHLVLHSKESQRTLYEEISSLRLQSSDLEYYLSEILDHSLCTGIKFTYMRCQFQLKMEEIIDQTKEVQREFEELQLKHENAIASLDTHNASEAQLAHENKRLSIILQAVKAELEIVACEKEGLLVKIKEMSSVLADVEDIKARAAMVNFDNLQEQCKYEDEICQLRSRLVSLEEELDDLHSSKVELEMTVIIFKSKMNDHQTTILMLERYEQELERLREQHSELTYKLSEQILKTEEFKNLSIHLRELKDKADEECLQSRERRQSEGSSLAMQDSLRIAFIKEQCESKLQEMRNQLSASKRYAEEMLLKLQTALDEVEIGKRSEASLSKRSEELLLKILDIEGELQTVLTEKREMVKAYDRMKAELECTILSLECCKEEKMKVEASLQECSEMRARLRVELDLVRRLLSLSTVDIKSQKNQPGYYSTTSIGEILEDGNSESSSVVYQESPYAEGASPTRGTTTAVVEDPGEHAAKKKLIEDPVDSGSSLPALQPNLSDLQDGHHVISSIEKEPLFDNSTKHIADIKEHFKEQQRLLTGMDLLHKELEKLKNDNLSSVIPSNENHLDPTLQRLQADLSQLDQANEHLRSISPLFRELPDSGSALEKVLAMELDFAEALQMKKSTDTHLQSSFLKQHNEYEAVFQSFRDINELIKDMLELKRRNAAVETELKEMQGRYSQLSLHFAEVEGERQQLVMTLKNRSPRQA